MYIIKVIIGYITIETFSIVLSQEFSMPCFASPLHTVCQVTMCIGWRPIFNLNK